MTGTCLYFQVSLYVIEPPGLCLLPCGPRVPLFRADSYRRTMATLVIKEVAVARQREASRMPRAWVLAVHLGRPANHCLSSGDHLKVQVSGGPRMWRFSASVWAPHRGPNVQHITIPFPGASVRITELLSSVIISSLQ